MITLGIYDFSTVFHLILYQIIWYIISYHIISYHGGSSVVQTFDLHVDSHAESHGSNPGRDWPKSLKQAVTDLLPNSWQQVRESMILWMRPSKLIAWFLITVATSQWPYGGLQVRKRPIRSLFNSHIWFFLAIYYHLAIKKPINFSFKVFIILKYIYKSLC